MIYVVLIPFERGSLSLKYKPGTRERRPVLIPFERGSLSLILMDTILLGDDGLNPL